MDNNYNNIEACIQRARQQRNEAFGEFLATAWQYFRSRIAGFLHRSVPVAGENHRGLAT